jgi:lipopolysaccharide export system permease protein
MTLLDRYIGRTVVGTSLVVLLVLVAIFSFFAFIEQIEDIGHAGYGLKQVGQVVLLSIPHLTYELLPMAALLGSLLALGVLANHNELVVIRAAGIPLHRTARSVMKGGLLLVLAGLAVGELLAPFTERLVSDVRALADPRQISAGRSLHGFWSREGSDYVHIERILPQDRVEGIHIYRFDDQNRLKTLSQAARGHFDNDHWILEDVDITRFGPAQVLPGVQAEHLATLLWPSQVKPKLLTFVVLQPERLALWDLVRYIQFLRKNGQSTERQQQALWVKVVYPLSTWVMVFLAIPLVLKDLQPVSTGRRILVGAATGLGFHLANQSLGHLGIVLKLSPALSVLSPTLAALVLALYLLLRIH